MSNEDLKVEGKSIETTEAEVKHLQEQVSLRKESVGGTVNQAQQKEITSQVINEYSQNKPEHVLAEGRVLDNPKFEKIVSSVDALPHREKIRELYSVMQEHGILNAIKVAAELNSPHIEEDFHHVIVHYIHTGSFVPGLDKEKEIKKELSRTLFEILVPLAKETGQVDPQQVLSSMQRFLSGIFGPGADKDAVYTFEIALANFSSSITFYISVPDSQIDLFKKQFLGNYPMARISEVEKDYNVFNEFGVTVTGIGHHEKRFSYVLALPQGPMESMSPLLAAFQKIAKEGEAAVVQYVVKKDDRELLSKTRGAIGKIRSGMSLSEATDIPLTFGGTAFQFIGGMFSSEKEKPKEVSPEQQEKRNRETKVIEEKIIAPFLRVDLRVVVSAATLERAEEILQAISATYGQFANRESSGGLRFDKYTKKDLLKNAIHDYTYRVPNDDALVLNHNEFAALFHPPLSITTKEAPILASLQSSSAPPPTDLPEEGTLVGESTYRGEKLPIRMTKQDRLRHLYVIGQTGTGKTNILKNMILEDIRAGEGACFIDPHGSDVQDILANIPKDRIDDVIYFDPTFTDRPFGLNMLEYDESKPEQKIFVVNELLSIFKKLYSSSPESMGPAFEQYFRNSTMLVMDDPASGNTMIDIMRVMADAKFRELKLSRCKNPIVTQFWRDIASKTTGDAGLQNMIPYIVNKFDVFIANDIMRPIIAQEKSSFSFREIMDNKKILLVNLSKGKLGEMNANLIGMILVGKIFLAAMSRVDSYGTKLPDFYLYIDEFQNISTPSIAGILSEARKYGLSLNIAHQYIGQLDEDIKNAVFGNVGSIAVFRVSAENAQFLESQFLPTFKADDLMKIESYNAYFKPLINGVPVPPFNIHTFAPTKGVPQIVEQLKQLSYFKYGRDRASVDEVILKKYRETSAANQQAQAKPATPGIAATRPLIPTVTAPAATISRPVLQAQPIAPPAPQAQPMPPMPQSNYTQMPQQGYVQAPPVQQFQPMQPSQAAQMMPQQYQQMPPTGYIPMPPQGYPPIPPHGYVQMPPPQYQQMPPQGYMQMPPQGYSQMPPQQYQPMPPPQYQQMPPPGYPPMPPPQFAQAPEPQYGVQGSQPTANTNTQNGGTQNQAGGV